MTRLATLLTLSILGGAAAAYPRPELLIEPADLAKSKTSFVILDARAKEKYDAGHVGGAIWVDHETWSKSFAAAQDAKEWSEKIGGLGIGNRAAVVVYDDAMSKNAARIWWILRYWGVKDARLLNGGWTGWTNAKLETSNAAPRVNPASFRTETAESARYASKERMLDIVKDKSMQIIDARSESEYCGEDVHAKKGGAIPDAINLEWNEALDKETQRFKSPAELTKILKSAGIDPTKPAVTYCQSGGRASVMAFTLELMGAPSVANYYRSWSEWGNSDDTPIATPAKRK